MSPNNILLLLIACILCILCVFYLLTITCVTGTITKCAVIAKTVLDTIDKETIDIAGVKVTQKQLVPHEETEIEFEYSYDVDGVSYIGKNINVFGNITPEQISKYQVGDSVIVYYQPYIIPFISCNLW